MRALSALMFSASLLFGLPRLCESATAIVPDDFPTIQLGIDSGADTVLVRGGTYDETVAMGARRPWMLMADPAASQRPVIRGLILNTDDQTSGIRVLGLHFLSPVDFRTRGGLVGFAFDACRFDSGLVHTPPTDPVEIYMLSIRNSMIRGRSYVSGSSLHMESDTIEAGGAAFYMQDGVTVSNCWIRGPGAPSPGASGHIGLHIIGPEGGTGKIVGNVFENCERGLVVSYSNRMRIENNVVRSCSRDGIHCNGDEYLEIIGNDVRDCGSGITMIGQFTNVSGNTVIGSARNGIRVQGRNGSEIRGNIVLGSGETGILIDRTEWDRIELSNNTSAVNAGNGFDLEISGYDPNVPTIEIRNNIAHGNGGWGLTWNLVELPDLDCNDWFGNVLGAVSGAPAGPADRFVDPELCDLDAGDVSLRDSSPLADAPGCGQIGARGVGCGLTAVLVALLRAEATVEGIRIAWRWSGIERPATSWIERAEAASGPWSRVATDGRERDGLYEAWDRDVLGGRAYFYRLVWNAESGELAASEVIVATGVAPERLAVQAIVPNPSRGSVEIAWTQPRKGPIELSVFDVAGREVAQLANGVFAAGAHSTTWSGRTGTRFAAPGVYLVRLRHEGRDVTRRLMLRR